MGFPYSSGDVLTAADLNQSSGMVFIKSVSVGSGVSSVTVSDAFSSNFDNYYVIVSGVDSSTTSNADVRVGSKTGQYYGSGVRTYFNSAIVIPDNVNNGSAWFGGIFATNSAGHMKWTFSNPNVTGKPVSFSAFGVGSGYQVWWAGDGGSSTTNFTDFSVSPSSGTISGGIIRLYGYNDG